jgi:hypothetical protein
VALSGSSRSVLSSVIKASVGVAHILFARS